MATKISFEAHVENKYCDREVNNQVVNNQAIDQNLVAAIPWQHWFEAWLVALEDYLPPAQGYELGLRLTNDLEIQTFNQQYRQKDKPTDVLAFATLDNDDNLPSEIDDFLYLGDIIISLCTANRQALEQHHSLPVEIAWLASHGFLHLLGWDHPDQNSLEEMLKRQSFLLKLVEITD